MKEKSSSCILQTFCPHIQKPIPGDFKNFFMEMEVFGKSAGLEG